MKVWNYIISKIDTPVWLEIFFVIIILLRIPSFFEPFYYGDEMIYLTLGQGVRQGVPLYLGLHDNKPPLLYLMAALAGNVFLFKALLAVFNLLAIYFFWKLVNNLFPKNLSFQKVSTILFGILTTIPLFEGNIANAENFMMAPAILAFYILAAKDRSAKNLFLAGVLFSIASLFKIVAAFDLFGVIAFLLIFSKKEGFVNFIKTVVFLSIGFAVPILLSFAWYQLRGAFQPYLIAAYLQNIGYVSSWQRSGSAEPFLVKNAPLLIRFGVMMLGFLIVWISSRKLSKSFVLVCCWLLASLFAVSLSERPYPHYFLQSVAPVSILLGMLFTFKNIEQSLAVLPLMVAFFVPYYYKFWHYPTTVYYQRFFDFASRQTNQEQYFKGFAESVPRNYRIAEFLNKSSDKKDKVFVWSNDSAAIYALSRRLPPTKYVADYHFLDFSTKQETIDKLKSNPPKFIVITPNSFDFPELEMYAKANYLQISEIESADVWMRI